MLLHAFSAQATTLTAANHTEAGVSNQTIAWNLLNGATVPAGFTASVYSIGGSTTTAAPFPTSANGATVYTNGYPNSTYDPRTFYKTLPQSGPSVNDSFPFCLTDNEVPPAMSCATISVIVSGNAPAITGVSPATGNTNGGTAVTLTGTGFTSAYTGAKTATVGGVAATSVVVVSATSATLVTPTGSAGVANIVLTVPGGASAIATADQFTYSTPLPPAPVVSGISPSTSFTTGGVSVTIAGTGFTGATAVNFDSVAATSFTVNSATSITATAPAHIAGVFDVTVTTPSGTSAAVAADQITYVNAIASVSGISPTFGPPAGGTSVAVTGTNLDLVTAVNFGSVAASSFSASSPTALTAVAPAEAVGVVDVKVVTAGGTSATSAADQFTYRSVVVAPTVTSISPANGFALGGTPVTITGTGFTGVTAVKFGSISVPVFSAGVTTPSYTVNSSTQISVIAPATLAASTFDVTVTASTGTSAISTADQYASAFYSCTTNYFVAATGGSDSNTGLSGSPWATISHAASATHVHGDCINLGSGNFPVSSTVFLTSSGNANNLTGYITYRATTPGTARIYASGKISVEDPTPGNLATNTPPSFGVNVDLIKIQNKNYIIFDGVEIDGNNELLNPTTTPHWNTYGGCIVAFQAFHVMSLNNSLHSCGSGGFGSAYGDWMTVINNKTYDTSWWDYYDGSGISIYAPPPTAPSAVAGDLDKAAVYHMLVVNNVAHDNNEKYVVDAQANGGNVTDGNGIIMDDFQNDQSGETPYNYKSLVSGNAAYANGGKGIHIFESDHILITGNAACRNNTGLNSGYVGAEAEMDNANGTDNVWTNNQMVTTSGTTSPTSLNKGFRDEEFFGVATTVTESGNATYDTRTGLRSYAIDDATRSTNFPTNNPLGSSLSATCQ